MSQEKFDDCLEDPKKKIRSTSDVLMKAFWFIIMRENFTQQKWHHAIHKFVNDKANVPSQTGMAKTFMRSNMRQSLVKDRLSWKMFTRAIKAIGIVKADIVIRYSFDGDNMKEIPLPVLDSTKKESSRGRKKSRTTKTDDGSNGAE